MTDPASPSAPSTNPDPRPERRRGRGRSVFFIMVVILAAGLTGALATRAFSSGHGFGPGFWRHGSFMGGPADPAQIEDRADRMVRHLAVEIDATNEQQEKLRAVVKATVKDLVPLRDKARAARQQARELLTQSTINRAEIEKFRSEQLAMADAASKRIAQALGDAAEILTPEQRRKINDHLPPSGGYWRGWHRG